MKISFVLPHAGLSGGIRVVSIYAERLKRRGHQVFVISQPLAQPKLRDRLKSWLKGQGWLTPPAKTHSHFDGLDIQHYVLEHPRPVTDLDLPDADVVVATWWETAEWVANLSPSKGAKVYFIQHYELHDYLPKTRIMTTYTLPMYKITIAQWLTDLFQKGDDDPNIAYVPNSVDLSQFHAPPRTKQPLPTIGLMYSTVPWKGCDISLKAFLLASQTIPDLRLLAFGSHPPVPNLPLPSNSQYFCQPEQEQLREIYAQCDVWLFGSRSEGFGLPILEAMACRTPVIGTPAGAAPELLTPDAGLLVKPEDPEDMAKAIVKLCQFSEAEWRSMSDAAYAKATSYTWEDATDLFEAALQTAIKRGT